MRIAITGATGSLGGALIAALTSRGLVRTVFESGVPGRRETPGGIVALSRDEVKSGDLAARFARVDALRCVLGDVRDRDRLEEVFAGCHAVIHAAALKRIDQSVYSPGEMAKTNVQGTINVIHAAMRCRVRRVLVVSSDKAVEPTNLYGATKQVAETYAVQANSYAYPQGTAVACVRYGNVLGSRGSVVGVWRAALRAGRRPAITSEDMTRFIITLREAADFCLYALEDMRGGEVFVPRLPAVRLPVLLEAVVKDEIGGEVGHDVIGLRPGGEKYHESLISREEPSRCYREYNRMTVYPTHHSWRADWKWPSGSFEVREPYSSDRPDRWLGVPDLLPMLAEVR